MLKHLLQDCKTVLEELNNATVVVENEDGYKNDILLFWFSVFILVSAISVNLLFKDLQKFFKVKDGIINDDDRQSLGATLPDFTYGMNNRFSYKNFDLNVFVDGVQGVNVLSRTVRNASNGQGFSNQFQYYYENRWHPTNNPNGFLARPDYTQSSERLRANVSSAFIEDGSFIRVRNITLGYSLPDQILEKINL